ncbi:trans-Golgi network integral membrane protein 2-like isoform X1 [Schistocerca nitens]|uniref:trans-Golgi network integral membrane protein 2-like isoform X1 n=1 Tax=Schistocerca nitens TaxID=7011 RepID=UPI0021183EEC|nr:trans-Golgi network integral membrane protein 2-like isoform X1 [Schistocerca nitens]
MKTLFSYSVHLLMFCACTCIFGIPQPRQRPDGLNNFENIFKKCQEVYDITKNSFLEQDTLLCFGLRVFSQQFPGGVPQNEVFEEVQKQSDADVCEHFQEMMLNSPLGNRNNSVVIYNQQFRDKKTCERACLDIMEHVNPICSILLALSLHSKENHIGSGAQTPSTTLPGQKADNNDDGVSEQSRNVMGQVPNRIPDEQKPKASGKGVVTDEEKAQASKEQNLHGDDKSPVQMTESNHQEQTSQGINLASAVDQGKLAGLTQQANITGPGSVKEKPKVTSGQMMPVAGRAKDEPSSGGTQEGNDLTTTNMNIVMDTLKKTVNSKKDSNKTRGLVTEYENQGKPDTLSGEKKLEHSSVALPESSGDSKNDQVTATGPNLQEKISTIENRLPPKKVDTGHQKGASISQVPNVEEDKGVVNGKKSQAENKETESPPQDEAEIQISSITETMPKNNINEQTTSQNNGKAYTNENSQTAQQSGRDGTQKAVSEEMQFTENTGAGVQEQDMHNPEDGESNDNTGYPSGGGTALDYGTPDSDAFDVDKNNMGAGTAVIRGKYDDDSHFFAYFMTTMVFCIVGYLLFHNKQKILALALEGRSRRGRRRPNTSGYRKLDSNLEEAISSSKSASVTQVIY